MCVCVGVCWASLCVSYLVRVVRVDYSGQPKVSDLQQQLVCVDEYVGRLQVSVQNVGRVDELQSPQQLVEQQRSVACLSAGVCYQDTLQLLFCTCSDRL